MMAKSRSNWWFLLPIFFHIVGGVIAYFVLRGDDPGKAKNCLYLGLILMAISGVTSFVFIGVIGMDDMPMDGMSMDELGP